MKWLMAVAVFAGGFEAVAAATPDTPDLGARLLPAAFAAVFLGCAWLLWSRRSVVAASVIGLFLVVDVGFTPFYGRASVHDWVLQMGFAVIGIVGIIAWVDVLRRRTPVSVPAQR
jgi:hypothetical protein